MNTSIVIKGHLASPLHIRLDEPVTSFKGAVEVSLRPVPVQRIHSKRSVPLAQWIKALPSGLRDKADMDRQLRHERDAWGDR